MIGQSVRRKVMVSLDEVEITVVHKSKTVWVAVGEYKGKWIEVRARSMEAAARDWPNAAFASDPFN